MPLIIRLTKPPAYNTSRADHQDSEQVENQRLERRGRAGDGSTVGCFGAGFAGCGGGWRGQQRRRRDHGFFILDGWGE